MRENAVIAEELRKIEGKKGKLNFFQAEVARWDKSDAERERMLHRKYYDFCGFDSPQRSKKIDRTMAYYHDALEDIYKYDINHFSDLISTKCVYNGLKSLNDKEYKVIYYHVMVV